MTSFLPAFISISHSISFITLLSLTIAFHPHFITFLLICFSVHLYIYSSSFLESARNLSCYYVLYNLFSLLYVLIAELLIEQLSQ